MCAHTHPHRVLGRVRYLVGRTPCRLCRIPCVTLSMKFIEQDSPLHSITELEYKDMYIITWSRLFSIALSNAYCCFIWMYRYQQTIPRDITKHVPLVCTFGAFGEISLKHIPSEFLNSEFVLVNVASRLANRSHVQVCA